MMVYQFNGYLGLRQLSVFDVLKNDNDWDHPYKNFNGLIYDCIDETNSIVRRLMIER